MSQHPAHSMHTECPHRNDPAFGPCDWRTGTSCSHVCAWRNLRETFAGLGVALVFALNERAGRALAVSPGVATCAGYALVIGTLFTVVAFVLMFVGAIWGLIA